MPHWRFLDHHERDRMEDLIRVFLAGKGFEGAGGFDVTEEVRLTIAAEACLLILGLDEYLLRDVTTVIVYPSTVEQRGPRASPYLSGAVTEDTMRLGGQARMHGPVMVAWEGLRAHERSPQLGRNVVHHEFAHKIDMADGASDGTPPIRDAGQRDRWTRVCSLELERVRAAAEAGEPSVLRSYAGTNLRELFAVATECFFNIPAALHRGRPELYEVLREFYRQDPAERTLRRPLE